jgi:hypothetical protein
MSIKIINILTLIKVMQIAAFVEELNQLYSVLVHQNPAINSMGLATIFVTSSLGTQAM